MRCLNASISWIVGMKAVGQLSICSKSGPWSSPALTQTSAWPSLPASSGPLSPPCPAVPLPLASAASAAAGTGGGGGGRSTSSTASRLLTACSSRGWYTPGCGSPAQPSSRTDVRSGSSCSCAIRAARLGAKPSAPAASLAEGPVAAAPASPALALPALRLTLAVVLPATLLAEPAVEAGRLPALATGAEAAGGRGMGEGLAAAAALPGLWPCGRRLEGARSAEG